MPAKPKGRRAATCDLSSRFEGARGGRGRQAAKGSPKKSLAGPSSSIEPSPDRASGMQLQPPVYRKEEDHKAAGHHSERAGPSGGSAPCPRTHDRCPQRKRRSKALGSPRALCAPLLRALAACSQLHARCTRREIDCVAAGGLARPSRLPCCASREPPWQRKEAGCRPLRGKPARQQGL